MTKCKYPGGVFTKYTVLLLGCLVLASLFHKQLGTSLVFLELKGSCVEQVNRFWPDRGSNPQPLALYTATLTH